MAAEFALVLHAHLPYVRPAGKEILEERWFHEAVAETYLPLLWALERLRADGIPVRLSLSLSGPLLSMLADRELMARCRTRLAHVARLAERESARYAGGPLGPAAACHRDRFAALVADLDRRGNDLISGFDALGQAGTLELLTAAGTHGYLPLLATDTGRTAQIEAGRAEFNRHFGYRPAGMWLPECAYAPGLDHLLAAAGVRWFVAENTTVAAAWPPVSAAAVRTPGGVAAFARDPEVSRQVWDSKVGYPGDPHYREFYRDSGYDLPLEEVAPWLVEGTVRSDTGLKFYRVTAAGLAKAPYDPAAAAARVREHAHNFAWRLSQRTGLVVAPFDAELFGHWWFEGPAWIEALYRELAANGGQVRAASPSDWLARHPEPPTVRLPSGSWGDGGDHRTWLSPANDWVWPLVHAAETRMTELAETGDLPANAVDQAARELLLAQTSDWPFILHTGTGVDYASRRVRTHLERFWALAAGQADPQHFWPEDGIFPGLNGRSLYGRRRWLSATGPLRILMLSWEFPPGNVGGLGRHVQDLGAALVRAGHAVHVVTLADPGASPGISQVEGMTVHRVRRPPEEGNFLVWVYRYNQALAVAAEQAAAEQPFDVVHSHDWLAGQAGLALKARWGSALVATIHATERGRNRTIQDPLQQAIHEEEWLLTVTADRVITVSQAMSAEVASSFRVDPVVIYNGVTLPAPAPAPPRRFGAPYFFFIGRLVLEKGVQVAVQALSALPQPAHLVVAGQGPMAAELRQLALTSGVGERVHFLGRITDDEKEAWLQHAAGGLVPSLYEPFGIVALEVMAAGTPVLVGDTGGLAEIITHGHDGLKVPPGDAAALARAMHRLLTEPKAAAAMSAAGRATAAQRFGWATVAEQTVAVYRDLARRLAAVSAG